MKPLRKVRTRVFQTAFFRGKWAKRVTPACTCTCTSLCLCVCLLCGAVSCRVSRVVPCYFLFVVRHWSSVVDCLSLSCALLSVLLRAFIGYWSVCVCRIHRHMLSNSLFACGIKFLFSLSLFLSAFPLSHAPVCRFKMPPCVRSKRLRVCRHHAHMCFNMTAWCQYTRRRFERTHGDVLNLHTGVFPACHTTHHTAHRTHTTTAQHTTTTRPHHHNTRTDHTHKSYPSQRR